MKNLLVMIGAALLAASASWAGAPDQFALHRAEFAKYHHMITDKDAPEGMVRFAIAPKISKSGKDAYRIVSCGDNAQAARCTSGTGCHPVQVAITACREGVGGAAASRGRAVGRRVCPPRRDRHRAYGARQAHCLED